MVRYNGAVVVMLTLYSVIVSSASYSDQPVFTLKQVVATCQHMIKEREEHIREEYDKVLNDKMQGV